MNTEPKNNNKNKIETDCENIESSKKPDLGHIGILSQGEGALENNDFSTSYPFSARGPNLNIEILSSKAEVKGKTLKITPLGLENSRRNRRDGYTYFGYENESSNNSMEEKEIDYLIRLDEQKQDKNYLGQHFRIRFNKNDMRYYIKDLGLGTGVFIKFNDWITIKNNSLFNIGDDYILFCIGCSSQDENFPIGEDNLYRLSIKIFSGNKGFDPMYFNPKDSPITIGRNADCTIPIEDSKLSRYHCTIKFKDDQWMIQDGIENIEGIKKSTNGTWIYAFDEIPITDKMTFKSNQTVYICNLSESEGIWSNID